MSALSSRSRTRWLASSVAVAVAVSLAAGLGTAFAVHDAVPPPPPSIGTNIPQSYFGPPASQSFSENNESLVGQVQLLKSGTVDQKANTTTIPLYLGRDRNGKNV